jgi:hypothetical protein
VQFEDEIFGKVGLITPNDPAYPRGNETVFVAYGLLINVRVKKG